MSVSGRDTDESLTAVPGGRPGEDGGDASQSDSSDEEPPAKKPATNQAGGSKPRRTPPPRRRHSDSQSPDRAALEAHYFKIMEMPDSRRTVAERAEVRQILAVQLIERMLSNNVPDNNIVFM